MGVAAADLVREAENRGARFQIVGDRLTAHPADAFDERLIAAIGRYKNEVIAVLREREEGCATDAVLTAQHLLREARFPPTRSEDCAFHCGYVGEPCRRCGHPWNEHVGARPNA